MLSACRRPFPTHRCGQCSYCRVLDRLDKVNRLKLEHGLRPYSFFVTLTYSDEFLPPELRKADLVKFIDKIRNRLPKITIFAVGEYGGTLFGSEKASREIHPHYHLAIFCADRSVEDSIRIVCERSWRMGHTHILRLSSGLIDYITGYVSKKLTNKESMKMVMNLDIAPEFTYSSRRPAIGDISDQLIPIMEEHGELTHLMIDGKKVVMPKYLRFKLKDLFLRWDLDLKDPEQLKEYERRKYEKKIENLQVMREKEDSQLAELASRTSLAGFDSYSKKAQVKKQMIANFNSKHELRKNTKGIKIL